MSANAESVANTATDFISEEGGWAAFIQNVIFGGLVYNLYSNLIEAQNSLGTVVLGPVRALGQGMILLVNSTIGNVIVVFDAGTQATVLSFTDGVAGLLGPLAQPFSVGIGMLSVGVFIITVNRLEISPWAFIQGLRG